MFYSWKISQEWTRDDDLKKKEKSLTCDDSNSVASHVIRVIFLLFYSMYEAENIDFWVLMAREIKGLRYVSSPAWTEALFSQLKIEVSCVDQNSP